VVLSNAIQQMIETAAAVARRLVTGVWADGRGFSSPEVIANLTTTQ
jgi:hypothetical protein